MLNNSKGTALVFVLVFMAVLSVSVGSLIPVTTSTARKSSVMNNRVRAKMNALSGIEIARSIIRKGSQTYKERTIELQKGKVNITIRSALDSFVVVCRGMYGDECFVLEKEVH